MLSLKDVWVAIVSAAWGCGCVAARSSDVTNYTAVELGPRIRCRGKHTNPERDYV